MILFEPNWQHAVEQNLKFSENPPIFKIVYFFWLQEFEFKKNYLKVIKT